MEIIILLGIKSANKHKKQCLEIGVKSEGSNTFPSQGGHTPNALSYMPHWTNKGGKESGESNEVDCLLFQSLTKLRRKTKILSSTCKER